ncbi:MAG: 5'-nucleotidase C-terminal domain-containing protein [Bacteroidales bacterium]|nr:5'-nucleotidase C-terminal domain-containing protein [Bacteroidales bacterium]
MKSPFIIFLSLVAAAFLLATATASGQRVKKSEFTSAQLNNPSVSKITWTTTTINSRFEPQKGEVLQTQKIVDKYKPEVDKYSDPIGFCPAGLERGYPVAPMSNWATDVYLEYAQKFIDTTSRTDIDKNIKVDFALMNFGGMRTEMPKGNVSRYDILSIFPFDNFLVIEEMDGKDVKELMEFFAKTRGQAMSNVKLHIDGNTVKECLIGGKPLDENRKYVIATIDFLYNGGDNLYPLKRSNYLIETHKKLMDIFIEYIIDLTAKGKKIEKAKDDRLIVENKEK